jgi:hypothetical protein
MLNVRCRMSDVGCRVFFLARLHQVSSLISEFPQMTQTSADNYFLRYLRHLRDHSYFQLFNLALDPNP